MKVSKVGVIGGGVVGRATARAYTECVEVRVHDVLPERSTHGLKETLDADIVFVCLPTPPRVDNGVHDLSHIEDFFGSYVYASRNFVLRSTVPVGTTEYLRSQYKLQNLVHFPEFLTARCAEVDVCIPTRHIVGGHVCASSVALITLLGKRYPHVPVQLVGSRESELIKLALNSFYAVKVAFFNELHQYAEAVDAKWDRVLCGMLTSGRISPSHTDVPGPDGKYGFGGTCLPVNLIQLATDIMSQGLRADITMAAYNRNLGDREGKS
jgi:nucleotide sugar dehydrogenase